MRKNRTNQYKILKAGTFSGGGGGGNANLWTNDFMGVSESERRLPESETRLLDQPPPQKKKPQKSLQAASVTVKSGGCFNTFGFISGGQNPFFSSIAWWNF